MHQSLNAYETIKLHLDESTEFVVVRQRAKDARFAAGVIGG